MSDKKVGCGLLSFREKLIYGSGEATLTMSFSMLSAFLLFFLTDTAGVPPVTAANMILFTRICRIVMGPIIGMISDNTRSKWGRRRPYILIFALPMTISFVLIWRILPDATLTTKNIYYFVILFLFYSSSPFWEIPYNSLGMELTDNYNERTSLSNFRAIISMPFGFLATGIPSILIVSNKGAAHGFFTTAIIGGILCLVPPILIFAYTKERFGKNAEKKSNKPKSVVPLINNRPFICANIIILSHKMALGIQEGFLVYYVTYWLNSKEQLVFFAPVMGFAWLIATPLWKNFTINYGKKAANIMSSAVWAVGLIIQLTVNSNTSLLLLLFIQFIIGCGYGHAHIVPQSMIADVADYDEFKNNTRREGMIFGFFNTFGSIGAAISLIPASLLLTKTGYIPNVVQSILVKNAIRYFMAFGPVIMLIIGIIATYFYNISRKQYEEIRLALEKRHSLSE